MSSRLKSLGFGSKRKSAVNIQTSAAPSPNGSTTTAGGHSTPPPPQAGPPANSSQTSLPPPNPAQAAMNQQTLGRPPSYSYNNAAGRPTSPMPPTQQQQMAAPHHPGQIDTRQSSYMGQQPQQQMGPPQPPGYGGAYNQMQQQQQQQGGLQYMNAQHVPGRAAEVEGAGRSKAQLIVGIDFVSRKCTNDSMELMKSRVPLSPASLSPLRPTPRPRKTSLQNGLAPAIRQSKRYGQFKPSRDCFLTTF